MESFLSALLQNPAVSEIVVDNTNPIIVKADNGTAHPGKPYVYLTTEALIADINRIIAPASFTANLHTPYDSAVIQGEDGTRLSIIQNNGAVHLTLRRHLELPSLVNERTRPPMTNK